MGNYFDHVMLSRIQFGFTAMFHILWPVLTIGLSAFLLFMEAMWLKTKDISYYHHARFWTRIFLLNFGVGVASGTPMEFQFGTNWSAFSTAGGDVFGHLLGFEAATAFMLEASFIGIMVFGWKRVPPRMHLLSTAMVAFAASLSAFWIMSANSWMHTPTGGHFENGLFRSVSQFDSIFNPDMPMGVSHMWMACIQITLFVVGGISAWYILKGRHVDFFLRSFKIAAVAAVIVTPLQIWLGDLSGKSVFEHQPSKLAGMEAHWRTNKPGEGAPWHILAWPDKSKQDNLWSISIPNGLSIISTNSLTGRVKGLREFAPEDQPPVWPTFYSFRIMIAIGFALFLLMLWTLWDMYRGNLDPGKITGRRSLLYSWIAAMPLSYIAMEAGWVTREIGRQPWAIYGYLRTSQSASALPPDAVATSLLIFAGIYLLLFLLYVFFIRHILRRGPVFENPPRQALSR